MAYKTISIKDAINLIQEKWMFLPEIQRKFVWNENQIETYLIPL